MKLVKVGLAVVRDGNRSEHYCKRHSSSSLTIMKSLVRLLQ